MSSIQQFLVVMVSCTAIKLNFTMIENILAATNTYRAVKHVKTVVTEPIFMDSESS